MIEVRGRKLNIANTEYEVLASAAYPEKVRAENGYLGVKVALRVQVAGTNNVLGWHEMKGTYIAEKLSDYVENCFNGQETFYWDSSKNEGCDYCNARKSLPLDAEFVSFGIDGSYLNFKNNGRTVQAVEINYCPVCGKKISK